jgi:hypothetical protein
LVVPHNQPHLHPPELGSHRDTSLPNVSRFS